MKKQFGLFKIIIGTVALGLIATQLAGAATIKHKRPASTVFTLTKELKQGDTNAEVKLLQRILNSDASTRVSETGAGSPGNETDYFGAKTNAAAISFGQYYETNINASDINKYRNPIYTSPASKIGEGIVDIKAQRFMNTLPQETMSGEASSSGSTSGSGGPAEIKEEKQNILTTAREVARSFGGIIASYKFCNCSIGLRITVVGPFGGNFLVIPGRTKNFGGTFTTGPVLGKYEDGGSCDVGLSGCSGSDTINTLSVKGTVREMSSMLIP